MDDLQTKQLELVSLKDTEGNLEIPLHILHLDTSICPMENITMKSGDWVLINSMPWFKVKKGENSFKRIFRTCAGEDTVFGLKTS